MTTGLAALLTFALGAMAGAGQLAVAASAAGMVTLILGFRVELHRLFADIECQELTATLRLLLISVVMLPVLPDHGFGPWASINPYQIWWMVVMIAALSFLGYFAMKVLGERRGEGRDEPSIEPEGRRRLGSNVEKRLLSLPFQGPFNPAGDQSLRGFRARYALVGGD